MNFAIETIDLSKSYRSGFWMTKFQALSNLNLKVEQGEIFGFVGPNGAGKTTTIKILAGLQEATGGSAKLLGLPTSDASSRHQLGFLPERPYFYTHVSARELLRFYGRLFGIYGSDLERRIDVLLDRVGMTEFSTSPLGKYSKGMLQRIGLCQALLHEPAILIFDEPMSGLDPIGRALVRDVILEEREKGKTVFFSSHVLSDVEAVSDRVGILVKGELRGVGTVDELTGTTHKRFECSFACSEKISFGDSVECLGSLQKIQIGEEKLFDLMELLRAKGASIEQIIPIRRSLEEVFVDEALKTPKHEKPEVSV